MNRRRRLLTLLAIALAAIARRAPAVDCYTEVDPRYYETDVPALIHAITHADVDRIRADLITHIWNAPALPKDLPAVERDVANPFSALADQPNLDRIDRLDVAMDDYVSRMHLYIPIHPRRRLTIVHQGHNHGVEYSADTIRALLAQRSLVLVVHMPAYGPNTAPFSPVWSFHDPMFSMQTPGVSPFRYFLEPVVQAVNYSTQVLGVRRISMAGLSGGGWTTVLAAALDPRIRVSISVAGSLPLYLRRTDDPCVLRGEYGDAEQSDPELYALADYLDLYILASHGTGRGHLQVLNQYDSCCYEGVRFLTYRDIVKSIVAQIGGRYDIFLDSSHMHHIISQHALGDAILPFLRNGNSLIADEPPAGSRSRQLRSYKAGH